MSYEIKKTSDKCWTVVNKKTGAVKAKCTSEKKAKAQLRLLYGLESGWTPETYKQMEKLHDLKPRRGKRQRLSSASATSQGVEKGGYLESFKRKPGLLPPPVRKMLEKIGDEKITSLKLVRTPLSKFVSSLLNVISLGAYQKAVNESPYDSMFHLAMLINEKYVVEKNEVIKLYNGNPVKKNSETLDLSVSKDVSINELFENGRKKMGDVNFTNYDARTSNCQDFLLGLLSGSDLLTEEASKFIKQDPEVVFKKIPSISEKIGRFLTDVSAVGERVMEGEGFKETWVIHGGRLMPVLVGGAIPEDIMEEARRKYYLEKAKKEIEKEIPEVDRPQILPDYQKLERQTQPVRLGRPEDRHQEPFLRNKKKLSRKEVDKFFDEYDKKTKERIEKDTKEWKLYGQYGTEVHKGSYIARRVGGDDNQWGVFKGRKMLRTGLNKKEALDMLNALYFAETVEHRGKTIETAKPDKKKESPVKKKVIPKKKQMERQQATRRSAIDSGKPLPSASATSQKTETKTPKAKSSTTWRDFYASQVKGKKFKNRAEVNAMMKELSKKWKDMKGK